jgi:hypothetical protein
VAVSSAEDSGYKHMSGHSVGAGKPAQYGKEGLEHLGGSLHHLQTYWAARLVPSCKAAVGVASVEYSLIPL